MADLSNLKINESFQRVLQRDPASGYLEDLLGDAPINIVFNGTKLRYVDGTQQNNYVLTSDADGNATWQVAGGGGDSFWSASSVDGSFIVNSGMTNSKIGIGTLIPNHELSVAGTVSASTEILVGDGDGFISAATINSQTLSGVSTYGDTLYSGSTNLADILITLSAHSETPTYWSANTDGSISPSGLTTNIGLGTQTPNEQLTVVGAISATTNLYASGDTHTTNLILAADGYIMPSTSNNTIKMRAQTYDGEMVSIGPDLFNVNMDSISSLAITPTRVTSNAGSREQDFWVLNTGGTKSIETYGGSASLGPTNLVAIGNSGATSIGGTTSRWPTSNGLTTSRPDKTLQVNGITTIYSGGTGNSWSGDTTALTVVGDISGTTDLYISGNTTLYNKVVTGDINCSTNLYVDGNIYSGATNLADILITLSAHSETSTYWSASSVDSTFIVNSGTSANGVNPNKLGVGTLTPNHELTVSGAVSASTAVYGYNLYTNNITTTATSTDTLTLQSDTIQLKSHGGSVEYLEIKDDKFRFFFDGGESVSFFGPNESSPAYVFNAGSQDIDFKISGPAGYPTFYVYSDSQRIRIRDHVAIGANAAISHADAALWGLAVTGSSLFYGSETGSTTHAIHASGVISGSTEILVGDGDGFISAATIDAPTLSGVSTYGDTIYSGSTNLADILITLSAETPQYAYQYITFVGNVGALGDDNWVVPGNQGISNHSWNQDGGDDGTTTGSTTLSMARSLQHGYIRVPAGTKLVGVEGAIRSNIDDRGYAGLFTFLPDYEGPDTKAATLRILAQTPSSSNNLTNDPQSFKSIAAAADMHTFADGEMIIPALRRDSTSTQSLIGSFTVILKTLITT